MRASAHLIAMIAGALLAGLAGGGEGSDRHQQYADHLSGDLLRLSQEGRLVAHSWGVDGSTSAARLRPGSEGMTGPSAVPTLKDESMPIVTRYSIIRDLFEVTFPNEIPPADHKIADFDLPAGAVTHPAVLTFMAYPSRPTLSNQQFAFTLLVNGHNLGSNFLHNISTVFLHGPTDLFEAKACMGLSRVLPVTSPPILKAGTNTLSMHAFGFATSPGDTGVALSDIVLWWQHNI